MNIEGDLKSLKEIVEIRKERCHGFIESDSCLVSTKRLETLLTAYEKEKEKNKVKFEKILADDFKVHIDRLIMGKSISYPCGWIYKRDLIELINDIKWK